MTGIAWVLHVAYPISLRAMGPLGRDVQNDTNGESDGKGNGKGNGNGKGSFGRNLLRMTARF